MPVFMCFMPERRKDGYIAAGGRVLGVTAWDKTLQGALERAYGAVNASFAMPVSGDIGQRRFETTIIMIMFKLSDFTVESFTPEFSLV